MDMPECRESVAIYYAILSHVVMGFIGVKSHKVPRYVWTEQISFFEVLF